MKKLLFSLAAIILLFSGCDGVNLNIDDLPRNLSIYVRLLTSVEHGGWDNEDVAFQDVSSIDGIASDFEVGTVTVTAPQDSYVRSDNVTITPADGNTYTFAYWLFPSRTDEALDDKSTEGNIRYDDLDDGEIISLRTNNNPAELIGVFARDGIGTTPNLLFETFLSSGHFSYVLSGETAVNFTIALTADSEIVGTYTITDPKFRIFDAGGEAKTEWEDYIIEDGELDFLLDDFYSQEYTLDGIEDRSDIDSWKVIIIYEDASGDAYVVK